jgi:hypothetical protein
MKFLVAALLVAATAGADEASCRARTIRAGVEVGGVGAGLEDLAAKLGAMPWRSFRLVGDAELHLAPSAALALPGGAGTLTLLQRAKRSRLRVDVKRSDGGGDFSTMVIVDEGGAVVTLYKHDGGLLLLALACR